MFNFILCQQHFENQGSQRALYLTCVHKQQWIKSISFCSSGMLCVCCFTTQGAKVSTATVAVICIFPKLIPLVPIIILFYFNQCQQHSENQGSQRAVYLKCAHKEQQIKSISFCSSGMLCVCCFTTLGVKVSTAVICIFPKLMPM